MQGQRQPQNVRTLFTIVTHVGSSFASVAITYWVPNLVCVCVCFMCISGESSKRLRVLVYTFPKAQTYSTVALLKQAQPHSDSHGLTTTVEPYAP